MADTGGQTDDGLIDQLCKEPYGFDFFQALRRLENHWREAPGVGSAMRPRDERFRISQKPTLNFAPSTLAEGKWDEESKRMLLATYAFGLLGPNGPMPIHITEYVLDRKGHARDRTLDAFLNIFHHRTISLFYRAWKLNNKAADFDRPEESRFAAYIGSLFGLGEPALRDRDAVDDRAKLYYSGRLVSQTRNAEGLGAAVGDFFGVPTEVSSFEGMWLELPPDNQCRLGVSPETGSLGTTAIVGTKVWDRQLKFLLRMGPMPLPDFQRMLPDGPSFAKLRDWVAFYTNGEFFWDLQLVLSKEEIPPLQLGGGARLGWSTWLTTEPFCADSEDLVLRGA